MEQRIITTNGEYRVLDSWFSDNQIHCPMLICGKSIERQQIYKYFEGAFRHLGIKIVRFMDFQSNPLYENVIHGVKTFREFGCDAVIAVGGGSAMDVAKCIKLYSNMGGEGENGSFLNQKIIPNGIPFLAVPTTAGTGSEATRFAVIYYDGKKQSVSDESCIPSTVLMDASVLKSLPLYQKKATMLDALCHAMESFWSVNSTEESRGYSKKAIELIFASMDAYLKNANEGNKNMLFAANIAGKAINISQTTAGHAMCYKITSLFGCAHGHAASLCDRVLLPWMVENVDLCADPRGEQHLKQVLCDIASSMGCETPEMAGEKFNDLFSSLGLEVPTATQEEFEELKKSVNPTRLKNHPIALSDDIIDCLYHRILNGVEHES